MPNHSWSEALRIDVNNTLRTCKNCGIVKRTRHEPDNDPQHWTEFEMDGRKIPAVKTPICEAA